MRLRFCGNRNDLTSSFMRSRHDSSSALAATWTILLVNLLAVDQRRETLFGSPLRSGTGQYRGSTPFLAVTHPGTRRVRGRSIVRSDAFRTIDRANEAFPNAVTVHLRACKMQERRDCREHVFACKINFLRIAYENIASKRRGISCEVSYVKQPGTYFKTKRGVSLFSLERENLPSKPRIWTLFRRVCSTFPAALREGCRCCSDSRATQQSSLQNVKYARCRRLS